MKQIEINLKVFRVPLIIPMALIELTLLMICWFIALFGFLGLSKKLKIWCCETLPDKEWYFDQRHKGL